jgi:hypothetical protein
MRFAPTSGRADVFDALRADQRTCSLSDAIRSDQHRVMIGAEGIRSDQRWCSLSEALRSDRHV